MASMENATREIIIAIRATNSPNPMVRSGPEFRSIPEAFAEHSRGGTALT
jgi:hypothetical protein